MGKVMERVENITGDVWELEGGVRQEQQDLVQICSSALVSIPEGHSVEEIQEDNTNTYNAYDCHDDHHLAVFPPVLVLEFGGAALKL